MADRKAGRHGSANTPASIVASPYAKGADGVCATDPWVVSLYEDWVTRLGQSRMEGFLARLSGQFDLLQSLIHEDGDADALHRMVHDVASTAGMLGFIEVTMRCRAFQDDAVDGPRRRALAEALRVARRRLDAHLGASQPNSTAA